jgi:hypothetical protein
VEDGEGVFAFVHASSAEDDGDEVDACVAEEWEGRGASEEFDVCDGDVADDVGGVVEDREGGDAFV